MGYIGIFGGASIVAIILFIAKPIYEEMKEDIFLKIGANQNMWGNSLSLIFRDLQELHVVQEHNYP